MQQRHTNAELPGESYRVVHQAGFPQVGAPAMSNQFNWATSDKTCALNARVVKPPHDWSAGLQVEIASFGVQKRIREFFKVKQHYGMTGCESMRPLRPGGFMLRAQSQALIPKQVGEATRAL